MARKQLKFDIKADNKSDRAFAGVRKNADKTAKHIKGRFKGLSGGLLGGAVGGLVAAVGVTKVLRGATSALEEFDLLAKRARTRGLSTDFYQGLKVGATEAGVAISMLESSLLAYVKRVGEAKNGLGPLVSGLKNSNPVLLENIRNSKSQKEALDLLADAIAKETTATGKAAIANAAFGRSGIEMVRILNQGADGMERTLDKARKLGLVIDKDLLANAEKVNNEFGLVNDIIGVNFKQVLVTLAPMILAFTKHLAGLARSLNETFGAFGSGGVSGLERQIKARSDSLDTLDKKISKLQGGFAFPGEVSHLKLIRQQNDQELEKIRDVLRFKKAAAQEVLKNKTLFAGPDVKPLELGGGSKKSTKKKSTRSGLSDLDAHQKQIEGVISALTFEAAQLGRTVEQRRIYNELQSAGVLIGSEEGQRIAGLVGQIEDQTVAMEQRNAVLDDARNMTKGFISDLKSGVQSRENFFDSLNESALNLANTIFDRLINSGIDTFFDSLKNSKSGSGGGGIGGLLGSLFKGLPGFATGGSFDVGGRGGVDNNLVAFRATKGENVTITPSGGGSGGGGVNIKVINQGGADVQTTQRQNSNGSIDIDFFIKEKLKSMLPGELNSLMPSMFGATPVLVKRG